MTLVARVANSYNKQIFKIARAGAIVCLVRLLLTGIDISVTLQGVAASVLWHLAADGANRVKIAAAGAIAPLVRLLSSTRVKQCATGSLLTLAYGNAANKVKIIDAGAMGRLLPACCRQPQ